MTHRPVVGDTLAPVAIPPVFREGDYVRLRYRGTTAITETVRFAGETETQYKIRFQLSGKWCDALYSKSKWEVLVTEAPTAAQVAESPLQRAFEAYEEDFRRAVRRGMGDRE